MCSFFSLLQCEPNKTQYDMSRGLDIFLGFLGLLMTLFSFVSICSVFFNLNQSEFLYGLIEFGLPNVYAVGLFGLWFENFFLYYHAFGSFEYWKWKINFKIVQWNRNFDRISIQIYLLLVQNYILIVDFFICNHPHTQNCF